MKWKLNESLYASETAQTPSILEALHMQGESRALTERLDPEQSDRMGFALERLLTPEEQEEVKSTYGVYELCDLTEDEAEEVEITYHLPPEWWDEVFMVESLQSRCKMNESKYYGTPSTDGSFEESMQLSGTKKLNGRRNLRRGKENPKNIKTAGRKTNLTGDYDLRETLDVGEDDWLWLPLNDTVEKAVNDLGWDVFDLPTTPMEDDPDAGVFLVISPDFGELYDELSRQFLGESLKEAYGSPAEAARDEAIDELAHALFRAAEEALNSTFINGWSGPIRDLLDADALDIAAEKAMTYLADEYY